MKRTLSQAQLEIINNNSNSNDDSKHTATNKNMAPGADDEGFMDHDAQVPADGAVDVTVVGAGPSGLMLA
jgi:hypothetical protein